MKRFVLILIALTLLSTTVQADYGTDFVSLLHNSESCCEEPTEDTSNTSGILRVKDYQQLMQSGWRDGAVVLVTTKGCSACEIFKRNVLTNHLVARTLNQENFTIAPVEHAETWAKRFRGKVTYPMLVMLGANGKIQGRMSPPMDPAAFLARFPARSQITQMTNQGMQVTRSRDMPSERNIVSPPGRGQSTNSNEGMSQMSGSMGGCSSMGMSMSGCSSSGGCSSMSSGCN